APYVKLLGFQLWDKTIATQIVKIGIPSSLQSFFEVGLFTGAVWLSGMLGTSEQAANQIALSMASMTFMFASGFSVASMIRVGNMMGAKNYEKAKIIAISILIMTILIYVGFALFFFLLNNY